MLTDSGDKNRVRLDSEMRDTKYWGYIFVFVFYICICICFYTWSNFVQNYSSDEDRLVFGDATATAAFVTKQKWNVAETEQKWTEVSRSEMLQKNW